MGLVCGGDTSTGVIRLALTTKTKERFRRASASVGRDGRTSHHRTAMLRAAVKVRSQSDAGHHHQLHGRAAIAAVYVVTAAVVHDGLKLLDAAHEA